MTSPGRYAAGDGSFARSTGNAAARGGILIGIAVLIGFVLLWQGLGGDDEPTTAADDASSETTDTGDAADDDVAADGDVEGDGAADTETGDVAIDDGTADDSDTTTPTTAAVIVDDPADVLVAVLNGSGTGGLAGDRTTALAALGYQVTEPANAAGTPEAASGVFYADGFADEAKVIAEALGGSADLLSVQPTDPGSLASTDADVEKMSGANVVVVLGVDAILS